MRKISLILVLVVSLLSIGIAGCGSSSGEKVVVGGKDYAEQEIMVHLVSELIENKTDIEVERKPYLGGSNVVAKALESGDLDICVEYTGTALMNVLGEPVMTNPDEVYELVKKRYADEKNIKWLNPLGFNNTWGLSMKKDKAKELGIKTISDLKSKEKDFVFASTQEFQERDDGYKKLKELYKINFGDVKAMEIGLTYSAIDNDQADVCVGYSTDGRIPQFGLLLLEDDKDFFPPYYAAPIIREDTLKKYPELEDILNKLGGKLNDDEMAKLNGRVSIDKKDAKAVAKEWLKEKGLIE